jgi:hypothetical protein
MMMMLIIRTMVRKCQRRAVGEESGKGGRGEGRIMKGEEDQSTLHIHIYVCTYTHMKTA